MIAMKFREIETVANIKINMKILKKTCDYHMELQIKQITLVVGLGLFRFTKMWCEELAIRYKSIPNFSIFGNFYFLNN